MKDKSLFRIFNSPYAYELSSLIPERPLSKAEKAVKDRFVANRMIGFGLYDMWGYGSTALKRNRKIRQAIYHKTKKPTETNLLNLLNVKYVASHKNMDAPGYSKVSETPYASVYRNVKCLPRAMLLREPVVIDDEEEMFEYITSKRFNPQKEILLEEDVRLDEGKARLADAPRRDKVEILEYEPSRVKIGADCRKEAFLLLTDTYYPGWKAYINEEETKIYRADYFLRAIKVPAGRHLIQFIYDPLSFRIGAIISILTLLSLLLYFLAKRLRLTLR